ncbi:ABC transporter permease [Cohnella abietis]|nr:ABC transporter permease subunit [Cohnella abietis]
MERGGIPLIEFNRGFGRFRHLVFKNRWLYLMLLPGMLYFLLLKYVPMWGILIAFKNFQPFLGFNDSEWVGLAHFERLFHDPGFVRLLRNTFVLAIYNILFFFPLPILLALLLHEVRKIAFKRWVQTVIYLPHFMSWVVVVGIVYVLFTTEDGVVNSVLLDLFGYKIEFLTSSEWFRTMITSEVIWKESGWGTIIFLAALAGVDPQLYEAARMDGASRLRLVWHISLPAMRSVIVILLILQLGKFMDNGFEQVFLMLNATNSDVGEVFDTYVYRVGITTGQFSYSTAVNLFKSVIGLVLVVVSNRLAKRFGEQGIY